MTLRDCFLDAGRIFRQEEYCLLHRYPSWEISAPSSFRQHTQCGRPQDQASVTRKVEKECPSAKGAAVQNGQDTPGEERVLSRQGTDLHSCVP